MGLLSTRADTTSCEQDDYFYKTNSDNSIDHKIERRYIFNQDLTPTSDVEFSNVTAGNINGSSYTPTILAQSGPINGDITTFPINYQSLGNMVIFSGSITFFTTATVGTVRITISIPVESNFTSDYDLSGTLKFESFNAENASLDKFINADTVEDGLEITLLQVVSQLNSYRGHFTGMYIIK